MLVKLFSIVNFLFEFLLMICEIRHHRSVQNLEIEGFERPTEEQRRAKVHGTAACTSCASLIVVALIVVGCFFVTPDRVCTKNQALELAVCTDCSIDNCIACSKDSTHCETCASGYVAFNGKCIDCDHDTSAVLCEKCSAAPR